MKAQELVEQGVLVCASYLVQDLSNLYWSGVNSDNYVTQKLAKELSFGEDEILDLTRETEDGYEVFEHWAVAGWLADLLVRHGERVVEISNLKIWCRTTTGQAIHMDDVFQRIAGEET